MYLLGKNNIQTNYWTRVSQHIYMPKTIKPISIMFHQLSNNSLPTLHWLLSQRVILWPKDNCNIQLSNWNHSPRIWTLALNPNSSLQYHKTHFQTPNWAMPKVINPQTKKKQRTLTIVEHDHQKITWFRIKLFPWRARPHTETTPMGSLTSCSVATASGSIRNFPFSSQYTNLIGRAGPVTGGAEDGVAGELGEASAELSFPRLRNLSIL